MKATSITERDPRNQPSEEIDSFLSWIFEFSLLAELMSNWKHLLNPVYIVQRSVGDWGTHYAIM